MTMRNLAIWGVIVLALVAIFGVLNSGGRGASARQVTYSEMLSRVDSGDIKSVKIHGQTLEAKDRQGATLSTIGPGPRAQKHWAAAQQRRHKTIAKIQAANTWELSAVPYIPVVENTARHAANLRKAHAQLESGTMIGKLVLKGWS